MNNTPPDNPGGTTPDNPGGTNVKQLSSIKIFSQAQGTKSDLVLTMDPPVMKNGGKNANKLLLNYKVSHRKLMEYAKPKTPLAEAITTIRQEEVFAITSINVLSHAPIRELKHSADDFLNSLTQVGFEIYYAGSMGVNKNDTILVSRSNSAAYVVTRVSGFSENERLMWARVIHASKMYMAISLDMIDHELNSVQLEMNVGDGPASQLPDDTLQFSEVSQTAQNTEITQQVDIATNVAYTSGSLLQDISTTEPPVRLQELSERYIRVIDDDLEFSTSNLPNDVIYEVDLPSGLYRFLDTTISTALQNFTLISCDVEFTFKVNANQAQCGRYIVSHWPNFDQMNTLDFDNVYRMMQRDHAIIDLSVSNDVVYTVKYENLRSFVAIQANEIGQLSGGNFARLTLRCLSPVAIADTGNPRCPFQIFARLTNVKMTGMRYPIPTEVPTLRNRIRPEDLDEYTLPYAFQTEEQVGTPELQMIYDINRSKQLQMPAPSRSRFDETVKSVNAVINAIPGIGPINKLIGNIFGNGSVAIAKLFGVDMERIKTAESRLIYMGMINKDRPVDITHPLPLLPQPVHAYSHGRGPYVSKKMRLEPESTTPHFGEHCTVGTTESVLDLAQIPGVCARFNVTTTMGQGDLLIELPVLPYDPRYNSQYPQVPYYGFPPFGSPPQSKGVARQLSPVAYFSQMYEFYSGSIVYEFLPIKTPSHNFTMQAAFIPFHGNPGTTTDEQMQSCKWKTIDFRTAETSSFTVPWISPIMMRTYPLDDAATQSVVNNTWNVTTPSTGGQMKDPGKIVVRLVNPLNPTPIVTPSIEVIVLNRAHTNLRFLSPKPLTFASTTPPAQFSITNNLADNGLTLTRPWNARRIIPGTEIPRLEMADGPVQKGDEQTPTEDPLTTAVGPYVQTLENHTNILDVCRRFQYHTTMTGAYCVQHPHLMPTATFPANLFSVPVSDLHTANLTGPNGPYAFQPLSTFRDGIAECFRYYRGSMNFAFHGMNEHAFEVTFFPPNRPAAILTGGLEDVLVNLSDGLTPTTTTSVPSIMIPTGRGFAHEVVDPRVNPIQTMEFPFYNPNIYNDIQGMLANPLTWNPTIPLPGDYTRRQDKSVLDAISLTMGQVIIRQLSRSTLPMTDPASTFRVRVSSAIGDDFRFYHFMGTPPVYYNPVSSWTMASGTTTRVLTRSEVQTQLVIGGVEQNPGPFFFPSCSELMSKGVSNTAAIFTELKNFVRAPNQIAGEVRDLKETGISILSNIQNVLAMYTTGLDLIEIAALATALLAALQKDTNWFSVITAFILVAKATGMFTASAVANATTKLLNIRTGLEGKELQAPTIGLEADGTMVASVLSGLIIEGLSSYNETMKKKIDSEFVLTTVSRFFVNFNFMRAGAICIFFNRFAAAISWLWKRAAQWIKGLPNYDVLKDPDFIRGFMEDYSFVMNEMNLSSIHMVLQHRNRYWSTVITAYYLKGLLVSVDDIKMRNPALLSAVNEIIKKSNDIKSHMCAPPVRYEPYAMWLWGEPGTGKSTITLDVSVQMAKNIGHNFEGDPVYTRSPHSAFWNGYDGQPIVNIDDANGVNDPTILGRSISEFQAMKTSARMRLEMARLEEKNAEMVSTILAVCSNIWCWKSTMIVDEQAFKRRRDIVAKVVWSEAALAFFKANPSVPKTASALPKEMTDDFSHIYFQLHLDPTSERGVKKMDYQEFTQHLYAHHKDYHNAEIEKMQNRYVKSLSLARQASSRVMDRTSLKIALLSTVLGCESSEVVSETIKRALYELNSVLPEQFKQLPRHTQYIIEKMKQTPRLESTYQLADPLYYVNIDAATSFMKEKIFKNFSTDYRTLFSSIYTPWVDESQRQAFVDDNITSPCMICHTPYGPACTIKWICLNSVEFNQHWVCTSCAASSPETDFRKCGSCRGSACVEMTTQAIQWNNFRKLSHLASLAVQFVSIPLKATFDYIWRNAEWLSLVSMSMTMVAFTGYVVYSEISARSEEESSLSQFIADWGVVPDSRCGSSNGIIYTLGDYSYMRDETGHYVRVRARQLEAKGKEKRDKEVKIDFMQPDMINQPSTSFQETVAPEFRSCENSESDLSELVRIEDIPCVPCQIAHGDYGHVNHLLNTTYANRVPMVLKDDGNELYNFVDDEGESHSLPVARCETPQCALNIIINKIHQRYVKYDLLGETSEVMEKLKQNRETLPEYITRHIQSPTLIAQIKKKFMVMVQYQKELREYLIGKVAGWFQQLYEIVCQQWKWIISAIGIVASLYFGYEYIYDPTPSLESPHAGQKSAAALKPLSMSKSGRRNLDMTSMYISKIVPPQVQSIADIVHKQRFTLKSGDKMGSGIVIANNVGLIPRHTVHTLYASQQAGEPVLMCTADGNTVVIKENLGLHIVEDWPHRELVVFQHKQLTGRDIRKHIFTSEVDQVVYQPTAYVYDIEKGETVLVKIESATNETEDTVEPIVLTTNINGKEYEYTARFYDYLTTTGVQGAGKCGSVLFNGSGQIIGMHVAGLRRGFYAGSGYNVVLYREFFDLPLLNKPAETTPANKDLEMNTNFPNLKYHSTLPRAPYHSEKSKIRPSAIAAVAWESKTFPCIQSSKDPRYAYDSTPLFDGAATIGAPTIDPEISILQTAATAVLEELMTKLPPPSMPVPVSVKEAVSAQNHLNVEPMKLNTSAGLPLIIDHPGKNLKSDFIRHEVKDNKHYVTFKNNYDKHFWKLHNQRKHGIPPREAFWAHLKDERRKLAKLLTKGGTRVFNVAALELVITSRMYLLPFMDAFHSDPVGLHHGIGLSPDSPMWTDFVEYHRSKGDCVIQLDFSKFSDSMPWDFVNAAFAVIKAYYLKYNMMSAEVEAALNTLCYEITRSLVCIGQHIYEIKNGTLQGHPITSLINSLVNMIEQVYVWCVVTKSSASSFFQTCSLTVMGDDVVIAVPKRIVGTYNGQTIAAAFAAMKIQVTDENKDPNNIQKYQKFEELSFMGRSFQLHPFRNVYLAPADTESIFDTPLWVQRADGPHKDATKENIDQSLSLMYGHGPLVYEMYRALLQYLCGDIPLRSWYELDYLFMKNTGHFASRNEVLNNSKPNRFYSKEFLKQSPLIVPGVKNYQCKCRFNCEKELLDRIKQCYTGRLEDILPFPSQLSGCDMMGARLIVPAAPAPNHAVTPLFNGLVAPDIRVVRMDHVDPEALYSSPEEQRSAILMDL